MLWMAGNVNAAYVRLNELAKTGAP
jgi:hypothetical protein